MSETIGPGHPLFEALRPVIAKMYGEMEEGVKPPPAIPNDIDRAAPILRDFQRMWDEPNTFGPGDIIRPRADSMRWKAGAGYMIVLDVHPTSWEAQSDCDCCVRSHNMRILRLDSKGIPHECVEHSRDFDLVERAAG